MAKSEIRGISVEETIENLVCQPAGRRENDFASSPHEASSPPQMKIRSGDFHVSIRTSFTSVGNEADRVGPT
jgi:hypothetical protein